MTTAYSMPMSLCKTGEPLSNQAVEFYANSALNSIFSFNFVNYKEKVPSSNEYLNEDAWKEYIRFINNTQIANDMKIKKLIVSSYFKTPAQILNQTTRSWRVKAHIFINLQSAAEYVNARNTVTLEIVQDLGQSINCGLKIAHILFVPSPSKTILLDTNFDDRYIPYKAIGESKLPVNPNDLKQPVFDDTSLITAVNLWVLKQPNLDLSSFNHPITISQAGVLDDRYAWRLYGPDQKTILVRRTLNNQEGITIQMEQEEWFKDANAANKKKDISLPYTFTDKNKIYSIKYPQNWSYEIQSPTTVRFTGGGDANLSLVSVSVLNNDPNGLMDFLISDSKKNYDLLRVLFPADRYTNLNFLQGEHITVKSASHTDLPAYSFVASYTSKIGVDNKFWAVMIARPNNQGYVVFLYTDDEENYRIYQPWVKAIFNTLSIN